MDEKVLTLLNQLLDSQKNTNQKLDRIEKKLDSVVDQTADLTEFRTETRDKLDNIADEVIGIRKDISNVEIITSSNWNDIAKLKAVK